VNEIEIKDMARELLDVWVQCEKGTKPNWVNVARHVASLIEEAKKTSHDSCRREWAGQERRHECELDQAKREAREECAETCKNLAVNYKMNDHFCDSLVALECKNKILSLNKPPVPAKSGIEIFVTCRKCNKPLGDGKICSCFKPKKTERIFERTGEWRVPKSLEWAQSLIDGRPVQFVCGGDEPRWILTCREVEVE
jgi:hypothetical protein